MHISKVGCATQYFAAHRETLDFHASMPRFEFDVNFNNLTRLRITSDPVHVTLTLDIHQNMLSTGSQCVQHFSSQKITPSDMHVRTCSSSGKNYLDLKVIVLQDTEMSNFGGVSFVCVVVQCHRVCTEVYE